MATATGAPTATPPPAATREEPAGTDDQQQRLMTGWVSLKSGSSGKTRRTWMAVTDVSLTAEDEKGGNKARAS